MAGSARALLGCSVPCFAIDLLGLAASHCCWASALIHLHVRVRIFGTGVVAAAGGNAGGRL